MSDSLGLDRDLNIEEFELPDEEFEEATTEGEALEGTDSDAERVETEADFDENNIDL